MKPEHDLTILGAGASGLVAAWHAASSGLGVCVIERASRPGNKVRIAGGGMGNVTNRIMGPEWYIGKNTSFRGAALRKFGTREALAMLATLKIPYEEREYGQIFCLVPASRLVEKLVLKCREHGVRFLFDHEIDSATHSGGAFQLSLKNPTGEKNQLVSRFLLVALGSPAWPQIGASELGARIASGFGHSIVPFQPVLAPFIMPEDWPLHGLSGISLPVSIRAGQRALRQDLLFTHKGISGPAALQASCFWVRNAELEIDYLPDHTVSELMHAPENGRLLVLKLVSRYLPARLAERLVPENMATRKVAEIGKKDRIALAKAVHNHRAVPLRTEGMGKAEAAAGGVDTTQIDPATMQSLILRGLFFSGEVMDVTGLLGGYNLHWAWASGKLAGLSATSFLKL